MRTHLFSVTGRISLKWMTFGNVVACWLTCSNTQWDVCHSICQTSWNPFNFLSVYCPSTQHEPWDLTMAALVSWCAHHINVKIRTSQPSQEDVSCPCSIAVNGGCKQTLSRFSQHTEVMGIIHQAVCWHLSFGFCDCTALRSEASCCLLAIV